MTTWTNESAIRRWSVAPEESLRATAHSGDFAKQNLINPSLFRLLGDLDGRRVLDAGYLTEYTIDGPSGADFHRPLSAYLNETARLGCRLVEIVEPGLDPAAEDVPEGCESYGELPNFVIIAARADGYDHEISA